MSGADVFVIGVAGYIQRKYGIWGIFKSIIYYNVIRKSFTSGNFALNLRKNTIGHLLWRGPETPSLETSDSVSNDSAVDHPQVVNSSSDDRNTLTARAEQISAALVMDKTFVVNNTLSDIRPGYLEIGIHFHENVKLRSNTFFIAVLTGILSLAPPPAEIRVSNFDVKVEDFETRCLVAARIDKPRTPMRYVRSP